MQPDQGLGPRDDAPRGRLPPAMLGLDKPCLLQFPEVAPHLSDGTSQDLCHPVRPEIGNLRLARVTPQALSNLYRRLLDKRLSAKTVSLVHAMLHRALSQALRWGLVAINVADAVDPSRPIRREFRTLTAAEAGLLLEAARGDRFYAIYVLALTCGLREAELLGLR